jgi:hypothetical protein
MAVRLAFFFEMPSVITSALKDERLDARQGGKLVSNGRKRRWSMDALTVWRGKGLLAACLFAALAAGNTNFARADQRTQAAGSDSAGRLSLPEKIKDSAGFHEAVNSDGVNALLLSGAIAFNPVPNPPDPTPTPVTPIPPVVIPPVVIPPVVIPPVVIPPVVIPPPPPPLGPDASVGPAAPPPEITSIPPVQTPEPTSLLIGLIGSACAGVVGWNRRKRQNAA